MVLVRTPTGMERVLAELRLKAISGDSEDEAAGLLTVRSRDARELLLADERSRPPAWWLPGEPTAGVAALMDGEGRRLATWLASMARDGFARERAMARLTLEPGPDVDRLIALRLDDPVEAVRLRAWEALRFRLSAAQGVRIAPILVRLSGRLRSAGAMARYAAEFGRRLGAPLWEVLLDHTDWDSRRWAFDAALSAGGIGPHGALESLAGEADQWVVKRLVEVIAGSGDVEMLGRLLASHHAPARAAAVSSLPDPALGDLAIESALFDRAATVRAAARDRAAARGIAVGALYRRVWDERRDPRALRGAAECGERFDLGDLRAYTSDPDPRVRSIAVALLSREDLDQGDVGRLFSLLDDPSPGPVNRAVRALAGCYWLWSYRQVADSWQSAATPKRRRLWRLLSGRGGWDRVRADLLAASDVEREVRGLGLADLQAWLQHAAAHMWHAPTDEQLDDVRLLLATAEIPSELREAIEFRSGLPLTHPPR